MRFPPTLSAALVLLVIAPWPAHAQTRAATAATDVYHVMFVKALSGQAAAVAKELQQQDPKAPQQGHYVVFRHQEGADWDFCVVEHLGTRATVVPAAPAPAQAAVTPTRAWHEDTFVAGPSWEEFSKVIGTGTGSAIYVLGVHRAAPGHRTQLEEVLNRPDPNAKVQIGRLTLTHLEGSTWQYLSLDRYNSWQDFATARAADASSDAGWLEVREHSAFHTDTIADRIVPR